MQTLNSVFLSIGALAFAAALTGCGAADRATQTATTNDGSIPNNTGGQAVLPATNNAPSPDLSDVDREFVRKAGESDLAEVKLGDLAEKNGASGGVKAFGKRLVEDYQYQFNNLRRLAGDMALAVPKEPGPGEQNQIGDLSKLSGASFDNRFLGVVAETHRDAITEFGKESTQGRENRIKMLASNSLPALREHLRVAEDLQKRKNP